MYKRYCNVCGLHNEACLHQTELDDYRSDLSVLRILWFALGFLTAAIAVLVILVFVNEKYL